MTQRKTSIFRQTVLVTALASVLGVVPSLALAAGLGKVTVLSGLGQPLRAELELTATREELVGMTARLAPQAAFQQAGIEYASPLLDLRFTVDKRNDGKPVVRVTSGRPVNEPFLDFLVELNWPAGRLMREYTFLLDPPEVVVRAGGNPVSTAEAKPVNLPSGRMQMDRSLPDAVAPAPQPAERTTPKAAAKPAPAPAAELAAAGLPSAGSHTVRAGDTLAKIANAHRPAGVSLEQMLLALYQGNPDAFIGRNMNRLKAGAIVDIPPAEVASAVPEVEARRQVMAQSADWNAYRQKLASAVNSMPERGVSAERNSAGRITAQVEEKTPAAQASRDQVKVSRNEQSLRALEEERIANDKAMKESRERLAALEKNVADLQKLLEMKNQKLAALEKAQDKPQEKPAEPAAKPVEPVKPPEAAKPDAPAEKPAAEAAKAEDAAKTAAAEPSKSAQAAEPPKPAMDAPKPEAAKPPPAPEPDPELDGGLLDNLPEGVLPVGAGGLLAALAALFVLRRKRDRVPDTVPTSTITAVSVLPENSVFQEKGGQQVDTTNTPPPTGEFSQTGPGTIDTDEVDPVAEADVYMAYGRDAQAEEILLEALNKDPKRFAIHLKLLEIYQGRKNRKQFEAVATELYANTGGTGNDWEKAAAMGRALDPANPLYTPVTGNGETVSLPEPDFAAVTEVRPPPAAPEPELPVAPLDVAQAFSLPEPEPEPEPEPQPEATNAAADDQDLLAVDFDPAASGLGRILDEAAAVQPAPVEALDFDMPPMDEPVSAPLQPEAAGLEFALDLAPPSTGNDAMGAMDDIPVQLPADDVMAPVEAPVAEDDVEFEMDLTESTVLGPVSSPFDMSSISLDLSPQGDLSPADDFDRSQVAAEGEGMHDDSAAARALEEALAAAEPAAEEAEPVIDFDPALREEVATKLDLAKAYEEMGDLEGARELLAEVISEGPPDLSGEAQDILGRIGA